MKLSYNWLKQFIQTDKTPQQLSVILTAIGLEVESLEKVQAIPGGLEGLVIGFVKECVQHPNADRLRITKVDVGTGEDLQIVCGASNVAAGQKVVVATVGTTVYPLSGEPFKINKSKIRGEASEGMICAEDEIGLGTSHEGIMELDADAEVGSSAKDYFNLNDDYVYEIGLTPNRADAASHLGAARDLAAFLKSSITRPDVSGFQVDNTDLPIEVIVENPEAAPRYSGLTISGIEVKDSPKWLKEKLTVIGIRSINNIVDVTNYVLHSLGQPMHAFDADAITGSKVIVKTGLDGVTFKTLDDADRKLSADDLIICNAEAPMCIAGVFGGAESGVKASTTTIFLESAYFNAVSIRKTSKRFGLKTDASFRFERGTDPDITVFALKYAAMLIQEVAGGNISSQITDIYPHPIASFEVELAYKHVDRLIGKAIPHGEIRDIITALDIQITGQTAEGLSLKVPPYRVDVTRDVDVIEEILRIYGYNNVEIPTQIRASLNNSDRPDKDTVQNTISDILTANGFNEILSNSLTKAAYAENMAEAVKILNPLSNDLDIMRQTLLYSGLEAVAYNINRRAADLKLYEFGKTYHHREGKYIETQHFALFVTGSQHAESWNEEPNYLIPLINSQNKLIKEIAVDSKLTPEQSFKVVKHSEESKYVMDHALVQLQSSKIASFYNLKAIVDGLLDRLNITDYSVADTTDANLAYGLTYSRGNKALVSFGMVGKAALKKVDIDKEILYASFNFDILLGQAKKNKIVYREVSKYPAVRRDLSMLIDKGITFQQLKTIAQKTERKLLKDVNVFDVYQGDKLPAGKKSYTLSFVIQDEEKTLTDKVIEGVMQKLVYNFSKDASAEVRK